MSDAWIAVMYQNIQIIGNGIYSYTECARFLGVEAPRLRAWYRGWPHRREALLRSDYAGMFNTGAISFLDFVDAAVCVTLKEKHGVSTAYIRKVRERLEEDWSTKHPFAKKDFYTGPSGKSVYWYDEGVGEHERRLVDAYDRQHAMPDILLPFLERVEYNDATGLAQVFPLLGRVVLDPRRKYGKPIVQGTGMPTAILYDCYLATESLEEVADWYNVTLEDVEEAVRFEEEFSGVAA